jgi:uncharacterized membrane-anchored protein YhcB (DUF1043 family)
MMAEQWIYFAIGFVLGIPTGMAIAYGWWMWRWWEPAQPHTSRADYLDSLTIAHYEEQEWS